MGVQMSHLEIAGRESGPLASFYSTLFAWDLKEQGLNGLSYHKADLSLTANPTVGLRHEPEGPPEVVPYFSVRTIDAYVDKALALGGSVRIPVKMLPDGGAFALVQDPEGNPIGLLQAVED